MARGRKKEELTLEEKLERALVPVEEQPYEVPENWCWGKLSSVSEIYTGNSINEKIKREKYLHQSEGLDFIATKDIGFDNSISYDNGVKINDYDKFKVAPENTSLLCIEGGSAGRKLGFTKERVCFGNKLCAFVSKGCVSKYVYYYLQSNLFYAQFMKRRHGLIGGVSVKDFSNFFIPIATIKEQQRIVERIESLFAKLDEVKQKVQEVIASIDDNVEALLYKAFTGQLTNEWRNSNIEIEKWEDTTLSEIVSGLKYGSSEKSDYEYKGTPILRIPNIGDGIVDFSDLKYMSEELKSSSHEVFEDDILIIRSNGSRDLVGKCALVPKLQERYAYASFLIRMKVTEKVLPEYLVRFINSSMARAQMFDKAKSSSGIHNINSKELGAIKICVPSIKEQKQILICIQEFVNKEKRVQEISEEMLGRIDRMKKSILAKAFRGELGTNNTNEESAIELFKTILVET